jgi:menaquinone-9 beta-reductase
LNQSADVAIIGAGLAGLASAILLARQGFAVTLFEQDSLPKHRVCGEYISLEAAPFVRRLGLDLSALGVKWIDRFELSTLGGRRFETALALGGFGVSRYRLDFALLGLAQQAGVQVRQQCAVTDVSKRLGHYTLETAHGEVRARLVLGCFGKRSTLDYALKRPHTKVRSPYIAAKQHFRGAFPANVVSLHVIDDGYCGVSPVEDDLVNVCYLTTSEAFKRHGGIRGFLANGLYANPRLKGHLDKLEPVFDRPLVISQLHFGDKATTPSDLLMLGDAAGLLHPLAGNGMAMALRSAHLANAGIEAFLRGKSTHSALLRHYVRAWQQEISIRRRVSRLLQRALQSETFSEQLCQVACTFPRIAQSIVEATHGQPF